MPIFHSLWLYQISHHRTRQDHFLLVFRVAFPFQPMQAGRLQGGSRPFDGLWPPVGPDLSSGEHEPSPLSAVEHVYHPASRGTQGFYASLRPLSRALAALF
jgi:hypothetical protein